MRDGIFKEVSLQRPKSNQFDLSHDKKLSTRYGRLTPIFLMDCVPGDKVSIKTNVFLRLAPLIAPIMHRVKVYCHFFFVPHRLVWPNWENFITGGEDGSDTSEWPWRGHTPSAVQIGSLSDYLGLPCEVSNGTEVYPVSAIPFASYQRIYNDWYRDQNLGTEQQDELVDGDNSLSAITTLQKRNNHHDYFTSALPFAQKGTAAFLPIGTEAPLALKVPGTDQRVRLVSNDALRPSIATLGTDVSALLEDTVSSDKVYVDIAETHIADLANATGATINELRAAIQLQVWLEKNARGGSRYVESMLVHFGVQSSDARLQRAELLGGFANPMMISEVLQTAATEETTTPQGTMAGHGISVGGGKYISKFIEEHGYIMGIMSVMPFNEYSQATPKHFLRSDRFDYYWPEFAHLGEQQILDKEIYPRATDEENNELWGYTPRYAEYKFILSQVHGEMRSTLDFWHLARKFAGAGPQFNQAFLECDAEDYKRSFAVIAQDVDNLYCHVYNEVKASRPMPVFGTPAGII